MSAFRTAYVYVNDIFAGKLEEIEDGYSFSYGLDYLSLSKAKAVSLTLPLQIEPFSRKPCFLSLTV